MLCSEKVTFALVFQKKNMLTLDALVASKWKLLNILVFPAFKVDYLT